MSELRARGQAKARNGGGGYSPPTAAAPERSSFSEKSTQKPVGCAYFPLLGLGVLLTGVIKNTRLLSYCFGNFSVYHFVFRETPLRCLRYNSRL
jgi:hypothetical protein